MDQQCAVHSNNEAIAICCTCHVNICTKCHRFNSLGYAICPVCETALQNFERTLFPWESVPMVEMPLAFFRTAKNAMFSPLSFFTDFSFWHRFDTKRKEGFSRAILFGLICSVFGFSISGYYKYLFITDFVPQIEAELAKSPSEFTLDIVPFLFIMFPLLGVVAFFMHWLMLHLGLRILGTDTTWSLSGRIAAYSSAAYLALAIPPVSQFPIGYIIAIGFLVQMETTAIRIVFQLPAGKTFIAVMFPFMVAMFFYR